MLFSQSLGSLPVDAGMGLLRILGSGMRLPSWPVVLHARGGASSFELCITSCTSVHVLLAITHAYKCSWQLKPRFSRYFAGGSAAQKAYFLKAKIMDLKIGLNCKSISVSHSPEIR